MSKTESVFLTPSWEDFEPAYNQEPNGLIVPNPIAGEPRPLTSVGVPVNLPSTNGGEPVRGTYTISPADTLPSTVWARIVPGTRLVESTHPGLISVLEGEAGYVRCDPPKKTTTRPKPSGEKED